MQYKSLALEKKKEIHRIQHFLQFHKRWMLLRKSCKSCECIDNFLTRGKQNELGERYYRMLAISNTFYVNRQQCQIYQTIFGELGQIELNDRIYSINMILLKFQFTINIQDTSCQLELLFVNFMNTFQAENYPHPLCPQSS